MWTWKAARIAVALFGLAAWTASCRFECACTDGADAATDSDADTDTDTDTDTDSDSDTDTDTDTDSDSDADICPDGEQCPTDLDGTVCHVTGEITADQHWTPGIQYVIDGFVFIGDDDLETTLCIDAGTTVYGSTISYPVSTLVVQRHSKIYANGTATNPILFTSSAWPGEHAPGDWGGVVINGLAPINGCADADAGTCELAGGGETGLYGGDDPDDSSGVLRYVRILWTGKALVTEPNALSLQGVGRGTEIHHIQIHQAADDIVEISGGTARVKHLIGTGGQDDLFDWTNGWTGEAQFVVGIQPPGAGANNGIEADNLEGNEDFLPRSNPTLYNFTLVGNGDGVGSAHGMLLRRGTAGTLRNMAVMGFAQSCLDIDTDATWAQVDSGDLSIESSAVDCATDFADDEASPYGTTESAYWDGVGSNQTGDLGLVDPLDPTAPDLAPGPGSDLIGEGEAPPDDGFFTPVDYIGAIDPDDDWLAQGIADGWIAFEEN